MEALRIENLEAGYRLPPSWTGMQGRLDGMLRVVLDDALELALEREGISASDEICVREVKAPVRLRLSDPDQASILRWSEALAGGIRRAVENGGSNAVVRYSSRHSGLVDFASGVASGNYSRAWAWSQLGFAPLSPGVTDSEAADLLVAAMIAESTWVAPVLQALARIQELHRLARRLSRDHWYRLAAAALAAAGARPAEVLDLEPDARLVAAGVRIRETERVFDLSSIATAAIERRGDFSPSAVPPSALAALIALEAEPDLFRRNRRSVLLRMQDLGAELKSRLEGTPGLAASGTPGPVDRRAEQGRDDWIPGRDTNRVSAGDRGDAAPIHREHRLQASSPIEAAQAEGGGERGGEGGRIRSSTATTPIESEAEPPAPPGSRRTRGSDGFAPEAQTGPAVDGARPGQAGPPLPDRPPPETHRLGRTAFGGLLFLLAPIDALGLNDELAEDARFKRRSLRWILHRLALQLTACEATDPAALAFCGLGPDTELPWSNEPGPDEEEREALEDAARRILAELRQRLDWDQGEADRLVSFVCDKPARIQADPGWLEVFMALEEVSTPIRRAALDLDPGFIPWLGVVVTFRYE